MTPRAFFLLQLANFLLSGVAQNLLAFQLDIAGLGAVSANNLLAAVQPLGACLVCLSLGGNARAFCRRGVGPWLRGHWKLAAFDLGGGVCTQASIALIGSGMFTVIYSCIVVYIAFVNRCWYKRDVSRLRWVALVLLCGFVLLAALGQLRGGNDVGNTMLGIGCALGAVVSYGNEYLMLGDIFQRNREAHTADPHGVPILSKTLMLLSVASIEVCVCTCYLLAVVVPRWDAWVAAPMAAQGTSVAYGAGMLALTSVVDGTHQIGFYFCTSFGKVAAVSSGVNKALQAAVLFVASALLFCDEADPRLKTQCLNVNKILGTVGVCCGVLLYAFDKPIARACGCGKAARGGAVVVHHHRLPGGEEADDDVWLDPEDLDGVESPLARASSIHSGVGGYGSNSSSVGSPVGPPP